MKEKKERRQNEKEVRKERKEGRLAELYIKSNAIIEGRDKIYEK